MNVWASLGHGPGRWLRGSFHGHCAEASACATVPLAESTRSYAALGAGFVTLTDHDRVTDLTGFAAAYPDLVFVEGFEHSARENLVFAGPAVPPLHRWPLEEALALARLDVLTLVCHPQPYASGRPYWTLAKLDALGTRPDGVEVFNGHYGTPTARTHGRQPLGTGLWDEALTAGYRMWGFANDDFHDPEDLGNAWNMVWAAAPTAAAVVAAARAGRSYASTGLLLRAATVTADTCRVELAAEATGRFVGPGGQVLSESTGSCFVGRRGRHAYLRFQAEGPTGALWLQPVFRDDD